MHSQLKSDRDNLPVLLQLALREAGAFLATLDTRPVAVPLPDVAPSITLPTSGLGGSDAIALFRERHSALLSGSAGPRYLGFVTGGTTPAALAGDWLTSAYDQNVSSTEGSSGALIDQEAISLLRQLFGLPDEFQGAFVTGATMANFVGLATARQWAGRKVGKDIAEDGMAGVPVRILSATPHASAIKALAMLGMGRQVVERVPVLPNGREAMDLAALAVKLTESPERPAIILASAGTVNTGDFDDLVALSDLCRKHDAWLHVDGAFGIFASCVPEMRHLLDGLERADSIAADGHKWLNVPYDAGFVFTRHPDLQHQVFRISAPYLEGPKMPVPDPLNATPENSSRLRALPSWMTLMAYGSEGYRDVVARNCAFAKALGDWISQSPDFELFAPVRLNVVCFGLAARHLAGQEPLAAHRAMLDRLRDGGEVFLTPTTLFGRSGMRAAVSNWRTTIEADLPRVTAALVEAIPGPA